MHEQHTQVPEASRTELALGRVRQAAIAVLDRHVLKEGRCCVCRTAEVCAAAMLADNNLATVGDLTLSSHGEGNEAASPAPP